MPPRTVPPTPPALVFDVGMHNGNDTAYYLHRGWDVMAVEANPVLCQQAAERFAEPIAAGRLTVHNVGIAEVTSEALTFWISTNTEWSSFDRTNATKGEASATPVTVPTVRFADLLYCAPRTPLYVKVDIEMHDSLCIRALAEVAAAQRPRYVSFEGHVGAVDDILFLAQLGYTRFKCVRQNDFRVIIPRNVGWHTWLRIVEARWRPVHLAARAAQRARSRIAPYHPIADWHFALGSSGPLASELPGAWMSAEQMVAVWNRLLAVDRALHAGGLGQWFDIHAAPRPSPVGSWSTSEIRGLD